MSSLVDQVIRLAGERRYWHLGPLLTDLSTPDLAQFQDAWARLTPVQRQDLVQTLVELAEERPEYDFRAIFRWLLGDEDAEVRTLAIEGLWEDESPALIGPLLHILQHDTDYRVRAAAAIALGRFVLLSELGEINMNEVVPVLEALIQKVQDTGEDLDVRRRALEAIAYVDEPHIRDLIEAAYYHHDTRMQASALFAMGRSANTQWGPLVLAELESPEPELRYEAALAAGELELLDAIPTLRLLVEDEDMDVRLAAIEALGRIGGPEAERILLQLADAGDESVSLAAEEALDELRFFRDLDDFPMFDFGDADFVDLDIDDVEP